MRFREFAEQVLFGASLSVKMAPPPARMSDQDRGASRTVETPTRPSGLPLSKAKRIPIPTVGTLRSDEDRARVLRALANHELLALELFALALLRFPDAPAGMRRGWVASMRDEQRHLADYLGRLAETGHAFEGEPLSAFFWEALAPVPDARGFVAGLQVCLEQANLDFARMWAAGFRDAGDPATAEVLDRVYEDEIRHLRVGLTWLERLREPGADPFDDFADALAFPLTVTRARGPTVDRVGRRRAGLSDAFIDRLTVAEVSRGRRPTVHWFAPHVEDEVAGRTVTPGPVAADLAVLPALAAATGDVVVAESPSTAFLARWREVGLTVPQFVPDLAARHLPGGVPGALAPWGWSPRVAQDAEHFGAEFDPAWRPLFSKAWAAELRRELTKEPGPWREEHAAVACGSVAEVQRARERAPKELWIKAAFSTAGQHRVRVSGPLTDAHERWVERALAHGPVVVVPHHDVVAELSVHIDVEPERVRHRGVVRFVARKGVFRGVVVGAPTAGLPSDVVRAIHSQDMFRALQSTALEVGERARSLGYTGPLGVDTLVVRDRGVWVEPLSEINPRTTMGRLGWQLQRRVAGRGPWAFLPMRAVRTAGFADLGALVTEGRRQLPDRFHQGRLEQGVVATNEGGTQIGTVLLVARRYIDAVTVLRELVPEGWPDQG